MSKLFSPFRAMGSVTSDVPAFVNPQYRDVLASVGRAYHVYDSYTLRLVEVSEQLPHPITAVAQDHRDRIVGSGTKIYIFRRKRLVETMEHSPIGRVTHLLVHGSIIISVGYDNTMVTWVYIQGKGHYRHATVTFPPGRTCNAVCIPKDYVNKVLVGTSNGSLHLYNVQEGKMIRAFKRQRCPICSLAASDVKHVVAIGLEDGRVLVHNLHYAITLFFFSHSPASPVTAVSFRHDGPQMLVSGTAGGEVAVWNLDEKRLDSMLTNSVATEVNDTKGTNPHQANVTTLFFFPTEPLLFSAGADNSIKLYSFARLGMAFKLKERQGHFRPISAACFFTDTIMISASEDRTVHAQHVGTDAYNLELSQGQMEVQARKDASNRDAWDLRKPVVVAMAACSLKQFFWPSLLTIHQHTGVVHSWRMDRGRMIPWILAPPRENKKQPTKLHQATAVTISPCGSFGVIGAKDGTIHAYSMQAKKHTVKFRGQHSGPVTGLHFDVTNTCVISVSGDRRVMIWNHRTGNVMHCFATGYSLSCSSYSPQNQHLAVACDDFSARLYDVNLLHQPTETNGPGKGRRNQDQKTTQGKKGEPVRTPIRHFRGHTAALTATLFSPDNAYFLTSSRDCTLRVFHISTNQLVDLYKFEKYITSMAFQPAAYFLATTHEECSSIFLWTNNLKYGMLPKIIKEEGTILNAAPQPLPVSGVEGAEVESEEQGPSKPKVGKQEDEQAKYKGDEEEEEGEEEKDDPEKENEEKEEEKDERDGGEVGDDGENDEDHQQQQEMSDKEPATNEDAMEVVDGDDIAALMKPDESLLKDPKPGMLTLSESPWPKWAMLPKMDIIRIRNRPVLPPTAHRAPFFLMTTPGLQPKFAVDEDEDEDDDENPSKKPKLSHRLTLEDLDAFETPFVQRLRKQRYRKALDLLVEMSPAKVDLELRDIEQESDLILLMKCLLFHLQQRLYFEVVQSCLSVILKSHGGKMATHPGLGALLSQVLAAQQECREDLDRLVHYNMCLIKCATKTF